MSGKITIEFTINNETKVREEALLLKEEALILKEEALVLKEEALKLKEQALKKPRNKEPKVVKPKGPIPPQLKKNFEWVAYTERDAIVNGWESFIVHKKNKENKTVQEIVVPASIVHKGNHIFNHSINEEYPDGKKMTRKYAMSLSKQRKSSDHRTALAFEAYYLHEEVETDVGPGC